MNRMLPKQTVSQALQINTEMSEKMVSAVDMWTRLYTGRPPWLWQDGRRDSSVQTLNLPATIAAKLAKLVTLEMQAELSGSARASYLQEQLQPLLDNMRRYTEYACAQGGLVFRPYVDGESIAIDITMADSFYPTDFNSRGEVTGAVFAEQIIRGNRYYTRLEQHALTDAGCRITNHAYVSRDSNELGTEIPLEQVEEWARLQPEATITEATRPLFAYFRIPQANTVEPESPLGVSVYARAVALIREADLQYSRILWEYEGAELAIDADITSLKLGESGGFEMPKRDKRLFRNAQFQGGETTGDFYKVFSPPIRDSSLYNGLDKQLRQIELACGLSFGTLSDTQNVDKTATEILASKQDMYATVCDIQKALKSALEQLLYAMDIWASASGLAPEGSYTSAITFKDSVTVDEQAELLLDMQLVAAKLMAKWEFRVKHYDETEEQARARARELEEPTNDQIMGFGGDG